MFCWQCGAKNIDTAKYCAACGAQLVAATPAAQAAQLPLSPPASGGMGGATASGGMGGPSAPLAPAEEQELWTGRPIFSGLESLSTMYELTSQRLRIHKGILGHSVDELELVRIKDVAVEQDMGDRFIDTGDVVLTTTDKDTPHLRLRNVADPNAVKELIRAAVRTERERHAGQYREIL